MSMITRRTRVYDPKTRDYVTVEVMIEVDWQGLADHFGPKVYANRSGKSAIQGGVVKATRIVK